MKRTYIALLALVFALVAAVAVAYPPAVVVDATESSITIGGLDCGQTYQFEITENGASSTTLTQATDPCPTAPPTAEFTWSPLAPSGPPVQVSFSSAPTTCPAGPCTFRWLHGSTQFATGATATFTYQNTGTKTVTLEARDSQGRVDTVQHQFVVSSSPTPPPPPPPTGGMPNADNTGPSGTLTPSSGNITLGTSGQVFANRDHVGSITVTAPNVTIRNSRIRSNAFNVIRNQSTGLVVEDSEIHNRPVSGQPNCHNGIAFGGYTIRRSEVTGCENGADVGNGNAVVQDNWIHSLDTVGPSHVFGSALGSPHTDGVQAQGGGDNIRILHNTIVPAPFSEHGITAVVILAHGSNPNNNTRVEDNILDGRRSAWTVYAPRVAATDVAINRNRMRPGRNGYTACVRPGVTVQEFSGNVDDVTGAAIAPDNGANGGCTL